MLHSDGVFLTDFEHSEKLYHRDCSIRSGTIGIQTGKASTNQMNCMTTNKTELEKKEKV